MASNIQDDQTELHLEINNCSRLWISSEFQVDWRGPYRSLYLHINNVYEVIQEETDESAGGVVPISDLISKSSYSTLFLFLCQAGPPNINIRENCLHAEEHVEPTPSVSEGCLDDILDKHFLLFKTS